jgi:8-oxo-dGTP pyrophosphatase MutT (NUDIX family)
MTSADSELRAHALTTLKTWDSDLHRELIDHCISHINHHADAFFKSCLTAHITVSALVLSPDRQHALLTLHPKVGRWLQMGGHCEPTDLSLLAAAMREAEEESGLLGLRFLTDQPVAIDAHPINCRGDGAVTHLDIQFALLASDMAHEMSEESLDLRWWRVDELPTDADAPLRRLIASALKWSD